MAPVFYSEAYLLMGKLSSRSVGDSFNESFLSRHTAVIRPINIKILSSLRNKPDIFPLYACFLLTNQA